MNKQIVADIFLQGWAAASIAWLWVLCFLAYRRLSHPSVVNEVTEVRKHLGAYFIALTAMTIATATFWYAIVVAPVDTATTSTGAASWTALVYTLARVVWIGAGLRLLWKSPFYWFTAIPFAFLGVFLVGFAGGL